MAHDASDIFDDIYRILSVPKIKPLFPFLMMVCYFLKSYFSYNLFVQFTVLKYGHTMVFTAHKTNANNYIPFLNLIICDCLRNSG